MKAKRNATRTQILTFSTPNRQQLDPAWWEGLNRKLAWPAFGTAQVFHHSPLQLCFSMRNHTSSVLMSIGLCVRFERSQCSKFTHNAPVGFPCTSRWEKLVAVLNIMGRLGPRKLGDLLRSEVCRYCKCKVFWNSTKKVQHQKWLPQTNGNPKQIHVWGFFTNSWIHEATPEN